MLSHVRARIRVLTVDARFSRAVLVSVMILPLAAASIGAADPASTAGQADQETAKRAAEQADEGTAEQTAEQAADLAEAPLAWYAQQPARDLADYLGLISEEWVEWLEEEGRTPEEIDSLINRRFAEDQRSTWYDIHVLENAVYAYYCSPPHPMIHAANRSMEARFALPEDTFVEVIRFVYDEDQLRSYAKVTELPVEIPPLEATWLDILQVEIGSRGDPEALWVHVHKDGARYQR